MSGQSETNYAKVSENVRDKPNGYMRGDYRSLTLHFIEFRTKNK